MNDAPVPKREQITVRSEVPVLDTGIFEQMLRIARIMATSQLVPEHLNRRIGPRNHEVELTADEAIANCFLVVNQAVRWQMDPFAVAQHVFVTKGRVGYEGKLVAAIINSHPNLATRLSYSFSGDPGTPDRGVIVSGRVKGDNEDRIVSGTIRNWKTDNESWSKIPDQMLTYRGAREWARRWMPEAILGVYAEEELTHTERDVTAEGRVLPPEPARGGAGDALRAAMGKAEPRQEPVPESGKQEERAPDPTREAVQGSPAETAPPAVVEGAGGAPAAEPVGNTQDAGGAAEDPKQGTPRLRKIYLDKLRSCSDVETLDILASETSLYAWSDADSTELKNTYKVRRAELTEKRG